MAASEAARAAAAAAKCAGLAQPDPRTGKPNPLVDSFAAICDAAAKAAAEDAARAQRAADAKEKALEEAKKLQKDAADAAGAARDALAKAKAATTVEAAEAAADEAAAAAADAAKARAFLDIFLADHPRMQDVERAAAVALGYDDDAAKSARDAREVAHAKAVAREAAKGCAEAAADDADAAGKAADVAVAAPDLESAKAAASDAAKAARDAAKCAAKARALADELSPTGLLASARAASALAAPEAKTAADEAARAAAAVAKFEGDEVLANNAADAAEAAADKAEEAAVKGDETSDPVKAAALADEAALAAKDAHTAKELTDKHASGHPTDKDGLPLDPKLRDAVERAAAADKRAADAAERAAEDAVKAKQAKDDADAAAAELARALETHGDDILPEADGPLGSEYAGFAPRTRVTVSFAPPNNDGTMGGVPVLFDEAPDGERAVPIAAETVLANPPSLAFNGAPDALHTVLVISYDAPAKHSAFYRGYVHLANCDVPSAPRGTPRGSATGRTLLPYIAPIAPIGAGLWRCAVLVFEQPPADAAAANTRNRRKEDRTIVKLAKEGRMESAAKLMVGGKGGKETEADVPAAVDKRLPADVATKAWPDGMRGPFDSFAWASSLGMKLVGGSFFAVGHHAGANTPALVANQEAFWNAVRPL